MAGQGQQFGTYEQRIGKVKGRMLAHAKHREVLGISMRSTVKFPKNSGKTMLLRRVVPWGATNADYNSVNRPAVDVQEHQLTEGVTPEADEISFQDVDVTLQQYACLYQYTDEVEKLYEDAIPTQMVQQAGERMGLLREMLYWGVLRAGSVRFYANGSSRSAVNLGISIKLLRRIERTLELNHADPVSSVLKPSMNEETKPVEEAYLVFVHTDCGADIRKLEGFTKAVEYGEMKKVHKRELGAVDNYRFVTSPELKPYVGVGGSADSGFGTKVTNSKADVYPIIVVGMNAWSDVQLSGDSIKSVQHIMVGESSKSDPLNQRGYIGCKYFAAPFIENDGWMAVAEIAVSSQA